jgi:hypothetical protein
MPVESSQLQTIKNQLKAFELLNSGIGLAQMAYNTIVDTLTKNGEPKQII